MPTDDLLVIASQFYKSGSWLLQPRQKMFSLKCVLNSIVSAEAEHLNEAETRFLWPKNFNKESDDEMKSKQNSYYLHWCRAAQWEIQHQDTMTLRAEQLFPVHVCVCVGDLLSIRPIRPAAEQEEGYESEAKCDESLWDTYPVFACLSLSFSLSLLHVCKAIKTLNVLQDDRVCLLTSTATNRLRGQIGRLARTPYCLPFYQMETNPLFFVSLTTLSQALSKSYWEVFTVQAVWHAAWLLHREVSSTEK